jgi:hypothetical protein
MYLMDVQNGWVSCLMENAKDTGRQRPNPLKCQNRSDIQ